MSANRRIQLEQMVKKIGPWAGVRYLRNQGIPLSIAYEIVLKRPCPASFK